MSGQVPVPEPWAAIIRHMVREAYEAEGSAMLEENRTVLSWAGHRAVGMVLADLLARVNALPRDWSAEWVRLDDLRALINDGETRSTSVV